MKWPPPVARQDPQWRDREKNGHTKLLTQNFPVYKKFRDKDGADAKGMVNQ